MEGDVAFILKIRYSEKGKHSLAHYFSNSFESLESLESFASDATNHEKDGEIVKQFQTSSRHTPQTPRNGFVFGRGKMCDIIFKSKDNSMSREHCSIKFEHSGSSYKYILQCLTTAAAGFDFMVKSTKTSKQFQTLHPGKTCILWDSTSETPYDKILIWPMIGLTLELEFGAKNRPFLEKLWQNWQPRPDCTLLGLSLHSEPLTAIPSGSATPSLWPQSPETFATSATAGTDVIWTETGMAHCSACNCRRDD
jgi:hypothetical protein